MSQHEVLAKFKKWLGPGVIALLIILAYLSKTSQVAHYIKFGFPPEYDQVENYWFSGIGIDHSYMWELKFASKEEFDIYLSQMNSFGKDKLRRNRNTGLVPIGEPAWWVQEDIDKMSGKGYTIRGNEFAYIHYTDHSNSIFVQWFDI